MYPKHRDGRYVTKECVFLGKLIEVLQKHDDRAFRLQFSIIVTLCHCKAAW